MRAIALLALLAACTTDAPATPNFQTDVMPIIAARCIRCHGDHPLVGARAQLDNYQTLANIDLVGPDGLRDRLTNHGAPPRFELDDRQLATLLRWIDAGRPRGTPRAGNRAPELQLDHVGPLTWEYSLRDPDRDVVAGTLFAGTTPIGRLHDGRDIIRAQSLAPGRYVLTVELDDGGELFTRAAGTLELP